MTQLFELVRIDRARRDAAIRLDDALLAQAETLVDVFTPTHSSIAILRNLQRAVLASAPRESRVMIWHGVYGSGKSHLGVLIGELLRRGTTTEAMRGFLTRLSNLGESALSEALATTFHRVDDLDARPYLILPLYGSPAPSLQNALLEGLYKTLDATPGLDPAAIVPKTEFTAALERLRAILDMHEAYRRQPLSDWGVSTSAFNLDELEQQLVNFDPEALEAFRHWHPQVSAGAAFDPQAFGGKGVSEAFREATATLKEKHNYNGIAILWDEFGYALENLLSDPKRNAIAEIFELQKFVESVCAPPSGHVLFIALTHRSLREYGASTQAAGEDVRNRLETIEGRFTSLRVELKNSEVEGYHLLSALVAKTSQGEQQLAIALDRAKQLAKICSGISVFSNLTTELERIITGCYPLHPLTAAGLFAIAAHGHYAQATRTVFTFYSNLEAETAGLVLERPVDLDALYGDELIRLPELLTVYRDDIFEEYPGLADGYQHAVATVSQGFPESAALKRDLLSLLLLSRVLGEQFQATDAFMAAALFDSTDESVKLKQELELLQNANLIWRRETEVPVWELESESGTQVEPLIKQELAGLAPKPIADYLEANEELRQELFPHCGEFDFDPSPAGILRSYQVRLIGQLSPHEVPTVSDPRLSALVLLMTLEDAQQCSTILTLCDNLPQTTVPTYVWIPQRGLAELREPMRRFIAISALLRQSAAGDSVTRRLRNELDKLRRDLRTELRERLGRAALERSEVSIRRIGDSDEQVQVQSWHGFTEYLARQVQARYTKEVQVRTMNANRVYNVSDRRINRIEKLLENILHFDELPVHARTDLLGETKETSELVALIDGTLGIYTNGLLYERANGWALKTPKETDGSLAEILTLVRDWLFDKRRKQIDVAGLRDKLLAPPYGLPPMVIPIFVAVAIRSGFHRLKWVGRAARQASFESQLWDAFSSVHDRSYQLRFEYFQPHQLKVLNVLHDVMRLPTPSSAEPEDQAVEIISQLRKYYKGLPDSVRQSAKLSDGARKLFDKLRLPGVDSLEVADVLQTLVQGATDDGRIRDLLHEIFESVKRIGNERSAAVHQTVAEFIGEAEKKNVVIGKLTQMGHTKLAQALQQIDLSQPSDLLNTLAPIILNKPQAECTDLEIGTANGTLRSYLQSASQEAPEISEITPQHLSSQSPHSVPTLVTGVTPPQITSHSSDPNGQSHGGYIGIAQPTVSEFQKKLAELIKIYQSTLDKELMINIIEKELGKLKPWNREPVSLPTER